jgi:Protein of unknown function (DUF3093)
MESNVETYAPAGWFARVAWFALAGAVGSTVIAIRYPFVFIPSLLFAVTSLFLFWLASRPRITVAESQFTIGERAIAWREVKEINSSRFVTPLVLDIRLTNNRRKRLVYPGEAGRIARLLYQLRRNSRLASFDGVAYRDYWTWTSLGSGKAAGAVSDQPVRMMSLEDQEEIERLYQRLKTVGHLDSRSDTKK